MDEEQRYRADEMAYLVRDLRSRIAELESALTSIRDLLPIEQDNYSRRVFAVAANALEPEAK